MRIIKICTAIILLGACSVGIFGCNTKKYNGDLRSFRMSCSHMNYDHCYVFSIRKEDGKYYFSADAQTNVDQPRTEFENKEVEKEDFEKLKELLEQTKAVEFLKSYKKPIKVFRIEDETTYTISLIDTDENALEAKSSFAGTEALRDFFIDLANKYH